MKKRILIVYAKTGGGHWIAAKNLKKYIEKFNTTTVYLEDGLRGTLFPFSCFPRIYEILAELPWLWKFIFESSRNLSFYKKTLKPQKLFVEKRLRSLALNIKPDIIFSTHYIYHPYFDYLRKKFNLSYKIVTIITDFAEVHPAWVPEGFDFLWVSSKITAREVSELGVPENKVKVLGFPVDEKFLKTHKSHRKGILVMGGARGAGPLLKIVKLLKNIHHIPVTLICGTNEELKSRAEKLRESSYKNLNVVGFTREVYNFMRTHKLLVSKPGGATTAEAIYTRIPFLAIDPLPGQEMGNVKFLTQIKAGMWIKELKDLPDVVLKCLKGEITFNFDENPGNYEWRKKKFFEEII